MFFRVERPATFITQCGRPVTGGSRRSHNRPAASRATAAVGSAPAGREQITPRKPMCWRSVCSRKRHPGTRPGSQTSRGERVRARCSGYQPAAHVCRDPGRVAGRLRWLNGQSAALSMQRARVRLPHGAQSGRVAQRKSIPLIWGRSLVQFQPRLLGWDAGGARQAVRPLGTREVGGSNPLPGSLGGQVVGAVVAEKTSAGREAGALPAGAIDAAMAQSEERVCATHEVAGSRPACRSVETVWAGVAQPAERPLRKREVASSTLALSSCGPATGRRRSTGRAATLYVEGHGFDSHRRLCVEVLAGERAPHASRRVNGT